MQVRELDRWVELCEWMSKRGTRRACRAEVPLHLRHLFNRSRVRDLEAKVFMVRRDWSEFKVRRDWRERLEALKHDGSIFGSAEPGKV